MPALRTVFKRSRVLSLGVVVAALLAPPVMGPAAEVNPPLPRTSVVIADRVRVSVEVARTDGERVLGLSNRPSLADGEGMLFQFGRVQPASIWMKDMRFPLDIIWIRNGRVVMIKERAVPLRPDRPAEVFTAEADVVLEVPAGFASAKKIAVGDTARIGAGMAPGNR